MAKFIEKESYLHKMAKELLASWLREEEDKAKFDGMPCSFCGIKWNRNYGVFVELPFYETSRPYYFEESKGIQYQYQKVQDYNTHHQQGFEKGKILFVPDITIFTRGYVSVIIEIVHTSEISIKKKHTMRAFFEYQPNSPVEVYTINAQSILINTSKPEWLNFQQFNLK